MIGGKIAYVERKSDRHTIYAYDRISSGYADMLCIDVAPNDLPMRPLDGIWWQSRVALWTPKDKSRSDVQVERIGYSYVPQQFPQPMLNLLYLVYGNEVENWLPLPIAIEAADV